MNAPRLIIAAIAKAIADNVTHNGAPLTEDQVYPVLKEHYIDGQPPVVVQIVTGAENVDNPGGGTRDRTFAVNLCIWMRLNLDPHGWSKQLLVEAEQGMLDFCEQIAGRHGIFSMTVLANVLTDQSDADLFHPDALLTEPLEYRTASEPVWLDEEAGVAYRILGFSGMLVENLPDTVSL